MGLQSLMMLGNVALATSSTVVCGPLSAWRRSSIAEFKPELLSEDEVEALWTRVTAEEAARARELSLTRVKEQI